MSFRDFAVAAVCGLVVPLTVAVFFIDRLIEYMGWSKHDVDVAHALNASPPPGGCLGATSRGERERVWVGWAPFFTPKVQTKRVTVSTSVLDACRAHAARCFFSASSRGALLALLARLAGCLRARVRADARHGRRADAADGTQARRSAFDARGFVPGPRVGALPFQKVALPPPPALSLPPPFRDPSSTPGLDRLRHQLIDELAGGFPLSLDAREYSVVLVCGDWEDSAQDWAALVLDVEGCRPGSAGTSREGLLFVKPLEMIPPDAPEPDDRDQIPRGGRKRPRRPTADPDAVIMDERPPVVRLRLAREHQAQLLDAAAVMDRLRFAAEDLPERTLALPNPENPKINTRRASRPVGAAPDRGLPSALYDGAREPLRRRYAARPAPRSADNSRWTARRSPRRVDRGRPGMRSYPPRRRPCFAITPRSNESSSRRPGGARGGKVALGVALGV